MCPLRLVPPRAARSPLRVTSTSTTTTRPRSQAASPAPNDITEYCNSEYCIYIRYWKLMDRVDYISVESGRNRTSLDKFDTLSAGLMATGHRWNMFTAQKLSRLAGARSRSCGPPVAPPCRAAGYFLSRRDPPPHCSELPTFKLSSCRQVVLPRWPLRPRAAAASSSCYGLASAVLSGGLPQPLSSEAAPSARLCCASLLLSGDLPLPRLRRPRCTRPPAPRRTARPSVASAAVADTPRLESPLPPCVFALNCRQSPSSDPRGLKPAGPPLLSCTPGWPVVSPAPLLSRPRVTPRPSRQPPFFSC